MSVDLWKNTINQKLWNKRPGLFLIAQNMLAINAFRRHLTNAVQEKLKEKYLEVCDMSTLATGYLH